MVFPRFVAEQEDPELIAERELAELEGTNTTLPAAVIRAKDASRAKQAAAAAASKNGRDSADGEEHRPMDRSSLSSISNSSASLDTVASSTAVNTNGAKVPKEAKADRKKRTRGVSGCSIKKDGGRFDMGFEDLEDVDYEDYDEDDFYVKDVYGDDEYERVLETNQEEVKMTERKALSDATDATSQLWLDAIQTVIVDQPSSYSPLFKQLLAEETCELSVIRRLAKEIQKFYNQRLETVLVGDVFSEYKIMELIRRLLEEDAIKKYSISAYLDMAVMRPHENIDHVQELFAWTMMEIDRFNHYGKVDLYIEIPKDAKKLATELVTENSVGEIAHLIQDILPCFHASFVFECFSQGILTMNMNKIYYCVQATSELYDASIISKESILLGLHRLVREVPELEKDLPCAKSMVHLVFSYATTMLPVTDEDKEDLEPPQHMLYANLSSGGHLEVCEPPKGMGPLSSQTFLMLEGDWPTTAEKAYVSPPTSEDESSY